MYHKVEDDSLYMTPEVAVIPDAKTISIEFSKRGDFFAIYTE